MKKNLLKLSEYSRYYDKYGKISFLNRRVHDKIEKSFSPPFFNLFKMRNLNYSKDAIVLRFIHIEDVKKFSRTNEQRRNCL